MIVVQELTSRWGKEFRSAGDLRRHVPKALPVIWNEPPACFAGRSDHVVLHHSVEFLGKDGFAASGASSKICDGGAPFLFAPGALVIRIHSSEPDCLAVKYKWSPEVGAPHRADRHLLNLYKGQWAQIVYNGRTAINGTLHTDWQYQQWTANVAFVDPLDVNVFLNSDPVGRFEELADLR